MSLHKEAETKKTKIVTRFAPSPTGELHIGGLRTALFNFLFAKHHEGEFLLRIEDTDKKRSEVQYLNSIMEGLQWLGISWEPETLVYQSLREARHKGIAEKLLAAKAAYESEGAVRLKVSRAGVFKFNDLVLGEISVKAEQIEDVVLLRSDGTPTYMLAVVVDDHDMAITHVIRGTDHMMNTFKQKIIYEALGWEVPAFAHIPLIHNENGAKLSKRYGAASVLEFKNMGILPEAFLNYLLRLGWSHGDQEIFSLTEAIKLFNIEAIGKSPACFSLQRLYSLNSYYLNKLTGEEILKELAPLLQKKYNFDFKAEANIFPNNKVNRDDKIKKVKKGIELFKSRVNNLNELADELDFYFSDVVPLGLAFPSNEQKKILINIKELLATSFLRPALEEKLGNEEPEIKKEQLEAIIKNYAKSENKSLKEVYLSLRLAIVSKEHSASILEIIGSLGINSVIDKINKAINKIGEINRD